MRWASWKQGKRSAGNVPSASRSCFFKHLQNLLARGAVNPRVGDGRFPVEQVLVLLPRLEKGAAFQALLLNVVDAAFDLALVARRPRLGRQQDRAVVLAEALQLRIQIWVVPVGLA